jgi:hypothetical protein
VTDSSGAVVPDVDVEIKDNRKGNVQSTRTDREGVYRFFFLAPSPYTLTATHVGFRQERRVVNVLLGPPGTVNVALKIAKTTSEIMVSQPHGISSTGQPGHRLGFSCPDRVGHLEIRGAGLVRRPGGRIPSYEAY